MSNTYRIDGPAEAPVLVMLNSLGTAARMWDPQVPALSARFRVIRIEHRGHGGSPPPAAGGSPLRAATDAIADAKAVKVSTWCQSCPIPRGEARCQCTCREDAGCRQSGVRRCLSRLAARARGHPWLARCSSP